MGLGLVAMYTLSLTQISLALVTLKATSRVASSLCTRIVSLPILQPLDMRFPDYY